MTIVPAVGRLNQEDYGFKTSLGYIVIIITLSKKQTRAINFTILNVFE